MKILKSQIRDEGEFRDALEKLRQAKIDHMMSEAIGTSSPTDPFLDQFIKRARTGPDTPDEITIDYEIVNDDPPPPTEEELKARAINDLRMQEQAEIEKIFPSNIRRLAQLTAIRAQRIFPDKRSPDEEGIVTRWDKLNRQIEDIQFAYAQREAKL